MNDVETLVAGLAGFAIVIVLIAIAYLVFYIIGLWKLFQKCGKDGWKAIIPFYNTFTLVEIAGLKWWWFLIACASTVVGFVTDNSGITGLASLAALFGNVTIYYNLSKKFNKSTGWVVLSAFFGDITVPVLGYSKSDVYNAAAPVSENGFFGATNSSQQPTNNQPMNNQAYSQPMPGQPLGGQMNGQQMPGQPMNNQQYGQPMDNQPNNFNGNQQ